MNAGIDQNSRQTLTAISSVDGTTIVELWADPTTHALLTDGSGGGGTPGSPDTSIQFNDSGTFGGDSHFTWSKISQTLGIGAEGEFAQIQTPSAVTTDIGGGDFEIKTGDGNGDGAGGDLSLNAGNGGATGRGGAITIQGGNAVDTETAGDVTILGGDTQSGGTPGNIYLTPGGDDDTNTGNVRIKDSISGADAALNTNSLSTSRTFTFPDKSGTFAMISDVISRSINSISAPQTAGGTAYVDYVYLVSGTTTLTMPTAVGNTNRYTVKNTGSAVVTISTTGGETIDGGSTYTLYVPYAIDLISDNSNWYII